MQLSDLAGPRYHAEVTTGESMTERLEAMARHMWEARRARRNYANLPEALKPGSIAEAYAAQEIYHRLAEPVYGPVGGVKVATTTRVMQQLMGITHPCGGAIFSRTIHASPARLAKSDFVNLRIESEIALKLGNDMAASGAPWTAQSVVPFVAGAMPAYELIEDRNAVYTETNAVSMIVENCWNGGVVIGAPKPIRPNDIIGVTGHQTLNGQPVGTGKSEDPFATLAWLANLLAERGRDLKAGMVVITGSLIPTFSVAPGDRAVFTVEGLGEAVLEIV
jgi:2-keto-4-pentenoate hydratase